MKITIDFECGEKTCCSFPGVPCRFLRFTRFGTTPICNLFDEELIQEFSVGTLRCEQCLTLTENEITN